MIRGLELGRGEEQEVTVEHKTFRLECAANGNGTVIWDDSGGWLEGGRGGSQPPPITTKRRYLV